MTAQNGLRYADECVRHKILDALGDESRRKTNFGKFVSCSGHALTNILLRESFKRGNVFVSKEFSDEDQDKLPGFDISVADTEHISVSIYFTRC